MRRRSIMLSQIQPHFPYNSLLGIKQLCDTEPKKASDALENLRDYLYLEKMRFPKKLNIVYEIDYITN